METAREQPAITPPEIKNCPIYHNKSSASEICQLDSFSSLGRKLIPEYRVLGGGRAMLSRLIVPATLVGLFNGEGQPLNHLSPVSGWPADGCSQTTNLAWFQHPRMWHPKPLSHWGSSLFIAGTAWALRAGWGGGLVPDSPPSPLNIFICHRTAAKTIPTVCCFTAAKQPSVTQPRIRAKPGARGNNWTNVSPRGQQLQLDHL